MKHFPWAAARCLVLCMALCLAVGLGTPALAGHDVGALGRIEPQGGVVHLMGVQGDTVAKILVKEGQAVHEGDALAEFDTLPLRSIELAQARLALRRAQELGAANQKLQDNRIASARADLEMAQKNLDNVDKVGKDAFSALAIDQRKGQVKLARIALDSAQLERERLGRDNALRMDEAREQIKLAQERLELATLRAPGDGTILEINKRVGEICGGQPFILMADLSVMYVVAEVFEADLPQLSTGQEASITGKALAKAIPGKVETIGRLVQVTSKEAKVRIRLEEPEQARRLINSEVNVSIRAAK